MQLFVNQYITLSQTQANHGVPTKWWNNQRMKNMNSKRNLKNSEIKKEEVLN